MFKKAFRDLFQDYRKIITSFLAIMIGMLSFGIMLFSYELITNELITTYSSTCPSSATLALDYIDDRLIELTKNFKDIKDFEVKAAYKLRGQKENGDWTTVELFSADDYSSLSINKVFPIEGVVNPGKNEMLIERDAMSVAQKEIGDTLLIQLPDGTEKELTIAGVINDLAVHPATMHNTIYAYISPETLKSMNLTENRIDILISDRSYDRENILTISNEYIRLLESKGYQLKKIIYESRGYSDIDILVYWNDRNRIISYMQSLGFDIYEMLGGKMAHHIIDVNNQNIKSVIYFVFIKAVN